MTSTKLNVGNLKKPDGTLTATDQETANTLNEYFSSVFEVEDNGNLQEFRERNFKEPLNTTEITEEKVLKILNELKNGISQGPEQIHSLFLKETKHIQAKLLATILRNLRKNQHYLIVGRKQM